MRITLFIEQEELEQLQGRAGYEPLASYCRRVLVGDSNGGKPKDEPFRDNVHPESKGTPKKAEPRLPKGVTRGMPERKLNRHGLYE